ncbi:FAD-dependent monooxygenase [Actinoallomurus soli]|uniref:FAD-dependent monooxygenase n=1 Tax=Actinoallomurus soli TaxID=2952535 RepID=UPI0020923935|nr:FAD-dependent monooxygenase [Actinoallomurus soli]MCO5969684.1 FAD-dependent monooxygenase [Actinoallomurus soli]
MLIVRAGPTGLTLACELARSGVSFRLIEAAPGPRPGSRGKGVQPRTLEVFDDLGVDRVIANGRMVSRSGRAASARTPRSAARPTA